MTQKIVSFYVRFRIAVIFEETRVSREWHSMNLGTPRI